MKKLILFLLGAVCQQSVCAQQIDWNRDLDFLATELSGKHHNFFTIRNKADFQAGIEAIKSASTRSTDFQTALRVQQLIATFGDSHTMLNFTDLLNRDQILPVQLLWTSDGLHVLRTTSEHAELLGRRVEAINRIPIATIVDSLTTLVTADNQSIVKTVIPELISSLQILEFFGFTDTTHADLTLAGGQTHTLKASRADKASIVAFEPDSVAFANKASKRFFAERYFPEEKIYYLLYNKCWSRELEAAFGNAQNAAKMPSFNEFKQRVFHTLKTQRVDKIVFDMRNNGGGNSAQGTRLIEKLAAFAQENPNITLYVVLGRRTFSSAILNAMDFKRLTKAIFVGEQTAGKPNHFGEVRRFELPDSKLFVSYSTKYFKRTSENLDTLTPDIEIEASFGDFAHGIDPVYAWIVRQAPVNRQNQGANK